MREGTDFTLEVGVQISVEVTSDVSVRVQMNKDVNQRNLKVHLQACAHPF